MGDAILKARILAIEFEIEQVIKLLYTNDNDCRCTKDRLCAFHSGIQEHFEEALQAIRNANLVMWDK